VPDKTQKSSAGGRDAAASLAAMRSISNASLVQEAARKALSAKELERTLEHFESLCLSPGDNLNALEETAEILRNAGFKHELMHLLRKSLAAPNANPHVGALWMRRVVVSKTWDHRYPQELDELCERGEVGRRALVEFLELVGTKRRAALVRQALRRHRRWLRQDPGGWAATGRALARARCYRQAVRWMAGWRQQPNVDLPTLCCLASALRATGKTREAGEVGTLALSRPGAASQFPILKLWSARDKALAGDLEGAAADLKEIDNTAWDDDAQGLYYLVRGLVRVRRAPAGSRKEAFENILERIDHHFRKTPIYKRDVYLRHEYRRCVTSMARASGQWPQSVTAVWRSAESRCFVLPLLVVPGLQLFLPCYLFRLCARRKGVRR
jgi:hypothetical protein